MRRLRASGAIVICASLCVACDRTSALFGAESLQPSVTLIGTPTRTIGGGSSTLIWTSTHATSCTASGGWSGTKATSGSESSGALAATTDFALSCTGPYGATRAIVRIGVGTSNSSAAFPLHVESGKRYLVDAQGQPFLIQGDSPWSLIVQLTEAEVDQYLDDRQARGFNTLLVNLLEHKFGSNAPNNAYGEGPFLTPGDFSRPSEAYFAHADWVLNRAAQKGFLVLLVPSYLGYGGGPEGWYSDMLSNGSTVLRDYGRYVGRRYKDYANILWIYGGDYNPPDRSLIRAIADGIRESDSHALGSAHCAPETAAIEYWGGESWLRVNNVYTYKLVYTAALQQYQRPEQLPFFLLESNYENEHNVTTRELRMQAYHALLSGAAGQVFGNNPIWHFDGPGLFPAPVTWQQALSGSGSQSMSHVWNLFSSRNWWTLVPDAANATLTGGLGSPDDRAVAALAGDRAFAIAYVPSARDVTINLDRLAGPYVAASWYDPANGSYTTVSGSPFSASGSKTFRPTGNNGGDAGDWVLVLESGNWPTFRGPQTAAP